MVHIWYKKRFLKKNRDYPISRFECFEHAKTFFICVKLWTCKLCNQWKIISNFFMTVQIILCFPWNLPNIQKCSFKECPFSWMVPMTVFLPFDTKYIICKIVEVLKKKSKNKNLWNVQGYIFFDMESSMFIDYLTNMCPTLPFTMVSWYFSINASNTYNFNAKYHHIINDLFGQFFFQPKTWEILVNLTKIFTFWKKFNNFIKKLEKNS